jgi:hypothetical protein
VVDLDGLPGKDLVERGLLDVEHGKKSVESLLVTMAALRLRDLGLPVSEAIDSEEPELSLYALLGASGEPDPYSRYNALRRELASFVRALEHRVARDRRANRAGR